MIISQVAALFLFLLVQPGQVGNHGRYFIEYSTYKESYYPTFLTDAEVAKFEIDLKAVQDFRPFSHLTKGIPESKPHGMFVYGLGGKLTSLFFQNATQGAMIQGADMKVTAHFTDGTSESKYQSIPKGMPEVGTNYRVHFFDLMKTRYAQTFDIVVHLKDGTWVKHMGWNAVGMDLKIGKGG